MIGELRGYARERLLQPRILALAALIALAAMIGVAVQAALAPAGATIDATIDAAIGDGSAAGLLASVVAALLLAWLMTAQCRLIDDLADLPVDRVRHPDRVLVKCVDRTPFLVAAAAATLPVLALLPGPSRIGYGLLLAALLGRYRWRRAPDPLAPMPDRVVLLKYPAFVLLIAGRLDSAAAWCAALLLYALVALADELDRPPARLADARGGPPPDDFEAAACPACGGVQATWLTDAQDDLTGKPGVFRFVTCDGCGLAYQSPRIRLACIGPWYDQEYIAHRRKTDWGWLTPLYRRAMARHDRAKLALVRDALTRHRPGAGGSARPVRRALDIGCGAGSFAATLKAATGCAMEALDFKDMSAQPFMDGVRFHHGLLRDQDFADRRFDLVTMWHFLEHDYDPARTLATARDLLGDDGLLVIEVPNLDSLTWRLYKERWPGLQAPQHMVLFGRESLARMVRSAGLEIASHRDWGAFPPYFYLFAGAAFRVLRGRGLNLDRAIAPYFLGQLLLSPLLVFERRLNLAMQTVVCRRAGGPPSPPAAGSARTMEAAR